MERSTLKQSSRKCVAALANRKALSYVPPEIDVRHDPTRASGDVLQAAAGGGVGGQQRVGRGAARVGADCDAVAKVG